MKATALYAAFDLYPSAKGAATHIYHFASTLFNHLGNGLLFVLGNEKMPAYQQEGNIEIKRFNKPIKNYLERAELYSLSLKTEIDHQSKLKLCHFRDPWSGLAILQKDRAYRTLYEVNGLLSIELPYRYPAIGDKLLQHLQDIEQFCLHEADALVCPSSIIKQNLVDNYMIAPNKITVITNGADLPQEFQRPQEAPENYIICFCELQAWQGINDLIRAFAGLQDLDDLRLVICSSNRPRTVKAYRKLAEKLGIADRIIWHFQLNKSDLYNWIHYAQVSVAPLSECSRNLKQGCSPLKIFESMACQTTVVASDLPVVREILTHNQNAKLSRPNRPTLLSRTIRFLLEYPEHNQELAQNALKHLTENFSWDSKKQALTQLYDHLLTKK